MTKEWGKMCYSNYRAHKEEVTNFLTDSNSSKIVAERNFSGLEISMLVFFF